jgi:hypothetical protein
VSNLIEIAMHGRLPKVAVASHIRPACQESTTAPSDSSVARWAAVIPVAPLMFMP